jgi:hypothetical protein
MPTDQDDANRGMSEYERLEHALWMSLMRVRVLRTD